MVAIFRAENLNDDYLTEEEAQPDPTGDGQEPAQAHKHARKAE